MTEHSHENTSATARLPLLEAEQWNDSQRDALGNQNMRGHVQNIFKTLAHHEKLAKRWLVFANHVMFKSTLPPRERELAILRMGWLCQAEYEWAQHVLLGREAGLSDEDTEHIKAGSGSHWNCHENHVLTAVDELHQNSEISDPTWAGLAQTYDEQQLLDFIFTCGQYNLVSMVLKSLRVPLDEDLQGFDH